MKLSRKVHEIEGIKIGHDYPVFLTACKHLLNNYGFILDAILFIHTLLLLKCSKM